MKTTKQIADELGVSKQKVYRFIKKNCINEARQENGVMYYDDVAENIIKQGFAKNEVHQENTSESLQNHINEVVIDALLKQLEEQKILINDLREENKKLTDELLKLSSKTGDALEALTQSQLADKLIEGKQLMDNNSEAPKGVVASIKAFFKK